MGDTHIMRIRKNYSNPNLFFADIFNNESVLKIKSCKFVPVSTFSVYKIF